ncbi:MAG: hypothetical protein JXR83_08785 [Deltaproteobacteria bacterium]|nr:hypothetical protein [Deltaproteobacteria bacterium]
MRRSRIIACAAAGLIALLVGAVPSGQGSTSARPVRISGLLFNGFEKGLSEADEAVRLTSTNCEAEIDIGDYGLSDQYGPRQRKGSNQVQEVAEDASSGTRTVKLPAGAKIPPCGDVWIAHQAAGFQRTFGYKPDFEAVETDPSVPNAVVGEGWISLFNKHGVVTLHDPSGEVVDLVAYATEREPDLDLSGLPPNSWHGPPLRLSGATLFGWNGQILARDRDEAGRLLPDTDSGDDWDSGFSRKQLGVEPTHRIELPGQTRFAFHQFLNVEAKVLCASAPENNFAAVTKAFDEARQSIWISVYKFTNDMMADHLVAALGRGVEVIVWTEGSPVGGLEDQSRYILDRLQRAGAKVYFLVRDKAENIHSRYRFDHSKFTLIDQRLVIIGTENYGRTGHPPDPSFGNRGFDIFIEHPGFVQKMIDVWHADVAAGRKLDSRSIDERAGDRYGLPFKNPKFSVDRTVIKGLFPRRAEPRKVSGRMDLALVLSPDNSLNENTSLLGLINRSRRELLVMQNSIPLHWGKRGNTLDEAPNLALAAVVAAARRGVRTRVLVDGTWYNTEPNDDRDNDDTVAYLNGLARAEKLDLQAKVANLTFSHLEKIHAKSVIVDGESIFIGSINWSENSFKGNREVGVIVRHPKVTGYYRDLFQGDWVASRLYGTEIKSGQVSVMSAPRGGRKLGRLARGERANVVAEIGGTPGRGPTHLEVALPNGRTGFIPVGNASDPILLPEEAGLWIGRTARVEGRVLRADQSDKVIRLHFTHGSGFVGVVFAHQTQQFARAGIDPAKAYTGKRVAVEGILRFYGVPEIILKKPDQIKILDDK